MTNKKSFTETEICQNYISPGIERAGWDKLTQIRREYTFTAGQVKVYGKLAVRGKRKRADYVLFYQSNLPLAVVEAKDNTYPVGGGIEQALDYAETLDVPFVFASNGDAFVFHDRTRTAAPIETPLTLDEFPSPDALWQRYRAWKGLSDEAETLARQPFYDDPGGKEPRYYQRIAVQRTVEAIARGQRSVLLVMATGTGKTLTISASSPKSTSSWASSIASKRVSSISARCRMRLRRPLFTISMREPLRALRRGRRAPGSALSSDGLRR